MDQISSQLYWHSRDAAALAESVLKAKKIVDKLARMSTTSIAGEYRMMRYDAFKAAQDLLCSIDVNARSLSRYCDTKELSAHLYSALMPEFRITIGIIGEKLVICNPLHGVDCWWPIKARADCGDWTLPRDKMRFTQIGDNVSSNTIVAHCGRHDHSIGIIMFAVEMPAKISASRWLLTACEFHPRKSIHILPLELLLDILNRIRPQDLGMCRRVCQTWKAAIDDTPAFCARMESSRKWWTGVMKQLYALA